MIYIFGNLDNSIRPPSPLTSYSELNFYDILIIRKINHGHISFKYLLNDILYLISFMVLKLIHIIGDIVLVRPNLDLSRYNGI